jgi:4-oxalocrotonate tautomerase
MHSEGRIDMPFINIKMAQGRTVEQKMELVAAITADVVKVLDVRPEWATVLIDEYPRENWANAGELHSVKFGHGYGKQGTEKPQRD